MSPLQEPSSRQEAPQADPPSSTLVEVAPGVGPTVAWTQHALPTSLPACLGSMERALGVEGLGVAAPPAAACVCSRGRAAARSMAWRTCLGRVVAPTTTTMEAWGHGLQAAAPLALPGEVEVRQMMTEGGTVWCLAVGYLWRASSRVGGGEGVSGHKGSQT